jgi:hypothetical protein
MEQFDRNIYFRAVDMSHERAAVHFVSRLCNYATLVHTLDLIEQGHVKPSAPINRFSFADIPSAIRFIIILTYSDPSLLVSAVTPVT